ncbi:MAG TPA: hypothetical protein VGC66_24710 [Pyrinomonadaceae bacterium]|jgi:hypothetical protein
MKREAARFSLMVATFILLTQFSAFNTITTAMQGGGNGNKTAQMQTMPTRQANADACRKKCRIAYRQCLRRAGGNAARRRACYNRYKTCLMHCG